MCPRVPDAITAALRNEQEAERLLLLMHRFEEVAEVSENRESLRYQFSLTYRDRIGVLPQHRLELEQRLVAIAEGKPQAVRDALIEVAALPVETGPDPYQAARSVDL